ncbi:MAG: hypothetical protein HY791_30570 [Deltaproteobacteria bacterium]|nr:hypothetical protein [Deltaproteobacteria bacterium]
MRLRQLQTRLRQRLRLVPDIVLPDEGKLPLRIGASLVLVGPRVRSFTSKEIEDTTTQVMHIIQSAAAAADELTSTIWR